MTFVNHATVLIQTQGMNLMTDPIWSPDPDRLARANMTRFLAEVRRRRPAGSDGVEDYPRLYRWSVDHPDAFWPEVWRFCGVVADERAGREPWDDIVIGLERMAPPDPELGPRWFPGARLNFAENLLRHDGERDAASGWIEVHARGGEVALLFAALATAYAFWKCTMSAFD